LVEPISGRRPAADRPMPPRGAAEQWWPLPPTSHVVSSVRYGHACGCRTDLLRELEVAREVHLVAAAQAAACQRTAPKQVHKYKDESA
jgi:hypothetical protein